MAKVAPKPVLKWAGGKWRVYDQIAHFFPKSYGRLVEPFMGGAAVFFREWARGGLEKGAVLTDTNEELVNLYNVIRDEPDELVTKLRGMKRAHASGQESYFYDVRAWDPATLTTHARAARIVYLNKTCFNGLYRVNGSGKFNVPFGRYENPNILDEENLRAAHAAFQDATIRVSDFEATARAAKKGDVVYFDPPYDPLSATSSFTSYGKDSFGRPEQVRLAETFARLSKRGVHCVLSNSDTPFIRETYEAVRSDVPEMMIERIEVPRFINSKAEKRGNVGEVAIATRAPPESALMGRLAQARLPDA